MSLSHRRLKVFGGTPDAQGTQKRPLPTWIDDFVTECLEPFIAGTPEWNSDEGANQMPNHVLLNEYSGGMGIAPHFDGTLYHQRVFVLNLQSQAVIWFWHVKEDDPSSLSPAFNLLLEPRSLLIFEGRLYKELKHGIENSIEDDVSGERAPSNLRLISEENRLLVASTTPIKRGSAPRLSLTLRKIRFEAKEGESEALTSVEKEEKRRREVNFYRNVSELN